MENFDKQQIDEKVRKGFPFKDRRHNNFHLEMPFGLINDPNGLTYLDGTWHIFFQWNPLGVVHKNKCWAYTSTKDFITYSVPQLAMHPTDVHDKDGCYSGCGLAEDGKVRVLYTCNSKDEKNVRTAAQRFGTLENGKIRKDSIIVPGNPEGYTAHFRDPYIFYKHGKRYFVLGAQRADETGCALLYEETSDGWNFKGEIKTDYKNFGYMWECPGLLQFGNYDAMIFCPQGLEAEEFKYQNKFQAGYIAGHLSPDSLDFIHGKFEEIDKGFEFYAPQAFNNSGRHILIGWMGMPDRDDDFPAESDGWRFSLTMPRELTLKQGHIFSKPARELKKLRQDFFAVDAAETPETSFELFEGSESKIKIRFGKAKKITLTLDYAGEKVLMTYDKTEQVMTIDRNQMKSGGKGVRKFKLFADEEFDFRLFVDKTAIELFLQHGEEVASFFVFPEKDVVPQLKISGDATVEKISGKVWKLGKFNYV